jgi:hypothetical protein
MGCSTKEVAHREKGRARTVCSATIRTGKIPMTASSNNPITESDLNEFVDKDSDFAFEMRVLNKFALLDFQCQHAGTYKDPVSGKSRQFDLRVRKYSGDFLLGIAAECKNLQPTFPLLVSAIPRTTEESYHDLIRFREGQTYKFSNVERMSANDLRYATSEMVGKKIDQVRRAEQKQTLVSDDSATFDKCSQAVNSCHDLIEEMSNFPRTPSSRVVVPALVVPSGTLFQVDYSANGDKVVAPRLVPNSTLFLGQEWEATGFRVPLKYKLSHLEIVTLDALEEVTNEWMSGFFPKK